MQNPTFQVGIDVSKSMLELSSFDRGSSSVPNTSAGLRRLVARLRKLPDEVVVCCEATGGYEQLLVQHCHDADIPIAVVNARQVRDFARSKNLLAKTDAIDAKVLAWFASENTIRLSPKPEPWREHLQALLARRDELNDLLTQERNRLEAQRDAFVVRMIRTHLRSLETAMKRVRTEIDKLIAAHQELGDFCRRMTQVKGVGVLCAVSLFAQIPELGRITDNQVTALAGLAPWCRDSGHMKGQRHIFGGRSRVRKALYMPAVSASSSNPVLREYYQNLIQRGKPAKVALTAVMRKLVRLANRVASDPQFIPT